MSGAYYPLMLDLRGRLCAVIGGGAVAEGKVARLLEAKADVTVVSPAVTPPLAAWARAGRIGHVARCYAPGDLDGQALAFVAVGDGTVAAAVAAEGRRRGVWVNAADDPARCDFILPSVLRRGRLTVAVSTGGASPALARAIREDLEARFPDDYAPLLELVAEVRREMRAASARVPLTAWRRALDPELRRLVADGDRVAARAWLQARLSPEPDATACC